jgi:Rad3-related DNA helicase
LVVYLSLYVGCVVVIDEAHNLDPKADGALSAGDPYKTDVVQAMVAAVQPPQVLAFI